MFLISSLTLSQKLRRIFTIYQSGSKSGKIEQLRVGQMPRPDVGQRTEHHLTPRRAL